MLEDKDGYVLVQRPLRGEDLACSGEINGDHIHPAWNESGADGEVESDPQ